jgi:hypothetical protein
VGEGIRPLAGFSEHGNEFSCFVESRVLIYLFSLYQIFRNDSVRWS